MSWISSNVEPVSAADGLLTGRYEAFLRETSIGLRRLLILAVPLRQYKAGPGRRLVGRADEAKILPSAPAAFERRHHHQGRSIGVNDATVLWSPSAGAGRRTGQRNRFRYLGVLRGVGPAVVRQPKRSMATATVQFRTTVGEVLFRIPHRPRLGQDQKARVPTSLSSCWRS